MAKLVAKIKRGEDVIRQKIKDEFLNWDMGEGPSCEDMSDHTPDDQLRGGDQ